MPNPAIIDCLTAAVFAGLFATAALRRPVRSSVRNAIGSALTALWAAAVALPGLAPTEAQSDVWAGPIATGLDIARFAAWFLTLLLLIDPTRLARRSAFGWRVAVVGTLVLTAVVAILDIVPVPNRWLADNALWPTLNLIGHLTFALFGLVIVENVWRYAQGDSFWSVKFLLLAVGSICAFDFYLYADALLFNRLDSDLFAARPLVALTTAPLISLAILRNPSLALSRQFVFHSAALLGGGLYLLIMGAAGLYIRSFGGSWGLAAQTAFMVGAGALLASILTSGSFRARAKLLIARHLFAGKYDYRQEWLRFIATLAQDDGGSRLRLRVVKAIAQIVESPGGSLWLLDESNQIFASVESWNDQPMDEGEPATGSLAGFLARTQQVVDLDELTKRPGTYPGLQIPDWLRSARAPWLIVPLIHRERLLGFAVLQRSRAPRQLDREDRDLLAPITSQAAGFLAEHQAQRALDDARELDLFNRRFAFVVHDVKTIISQMSLLLANADKHGQNPAFQNDLIASIRDSVGGMHRLLGQINAERNRAGRVASVDLVPLVRRLVAQHASVSVITLDCSLPRLHIAADESRMTAIVGHMLQNAVDAAKEVVHVTLRAAADRTRAVIEVADDGPGMDPEFVRDRLFRPLASTKPGGFGIGAYQCRELTRELGGWLTVSSMPGNGTTMRVTFPTEASSSAREPRAMAAT